MMNRIKIETPKEAYLPGEVIKGNVRLLIDRPVLAKAIKLEVIGLEETHVPVDQSESHRVYRGHNYILKKNINLQGSIQDENIRLEPGDHAFHFDFKIPEYALPSYSGTLAFITYNLRARVDVPFWKDMVENHPVHILSKRKALNILRYPAHFWSENYFSPDNGKPSFYVELTQTGYLAGEVIVGFITLKNMDSAKIRNIVIRLLGDESAMAQRYHKTVLQHKSEIGIPIDGIVGGIPIQLLFPTPKNLPPSYEGILSKFRWRVEVGLDINFGSYIRAFHPMEILC